MKHIAQTSLDKAGQIVDGSTDMLRGNVSGGIGKIIKGATDIATNSAGKGARILTQQFPSEEEVEAQERKKGGAGSRSAEDKDKDK
uniref:Rv1893 family protein n=1 Tax=Lolliginicoccus suaedae TaxID=2605429 RepID=UPI0011EC33DE|nr:hypothetical protein [Lolliginicoccus suaedae]